MCLNLRVDPNLDLLTQNRPLPLGAYLSKEFDLAQNTIKINNAKYDIKKLGHEIISSICFLLETGGGCERYCVNVFF